MSGKNSNMHIAEIWRYPVKSMAGELLKSVRLNMDGVMGDRRVLVFNEQSRQLVTSRTDPKLLGLKASLESGQVFVNGHAWDSPETTEAVIHAAGPHARLLEWDGMERFDILPLLVATDGAIKEFGYDHRRLRPNLVIGGVDGLAERDWPGLRMKIGKAVIEFAQLRGRCVMTTYDPDTQKKDPKVLRHIVQKFDGTLALDTDVIQDGQINVGDTVELIG